MKHILTNLGRWLGLTAIITAVSAAFYLFNGFRTERGNTAPAPPTLSTSVATSTSVPVQVQASTLNWKTYQNKAVGFSIWYPPTWSANDVRTGGQAYGLELLGSEGKVRMVWGSGFGGQCLEEKGPKGITTGWEPITIDGATLRGCHSLGSDGTEGWGGIGKQLRNTSLQIQALASAPSSRNRNVILRILSTLKILE